MSARWTVGLASIVAAAAPAFSRQPFKTGVCAVVVDAVVRDQNKYRELRVRVKRDGVTVLARRGYLAARRAETDRVRAHDVAPLMDLQQEKVPNEFPFTARTFAVPSPDGPDLLLIVATVPRESITQSLPANAPAALSLFARVKDAQGTPIR